MGLLLEVECLPACRLSHLDRECFPPAAAFSLIGRPEGILLPPGRLLVVVEEGCRLGIFFFSVALCLPLQREVPSTATYTAHRALLSLSLSSRLLHCFSLPHHQQMPHHPLSAFSPPPPPGSHCHQPKSFEWEGDKGRGLPLQGFLPSMFLPSPLEITFSVRRGIGVPAMPASRCHQTMLTHQNRGLLQSCLFSSAWACPPAACLHCLACLRPGIFSSFSQPFSSFCLPEIFC